MPKCFLCNRELENIKIIFKHFDLQHLNHDFTLYECNERECSRSFYLKNYFCKHLSKHLIDGLQPSTSQPIFENSSILTSVDTLIPDSDPEVNVNNKQFILPSEILNKIICNFISILYANPIMPRNAVQIVVDGMETVFSDSITVFNFNMCYFVFILINI